MNHRGTPFANHMFIPVICQRVVIMKNVNCLLIAVMISAAAATHAQQVNPAGFQSLSELQQLAENYVRDTVGSRVGELHVKAETLDPRLRLASCAGKPEVFLPSGANINARTTVGARCNNTGTQWT